MDVCQDRKPNPKDYRCPTYKVPSSSYRWQLLRFRHLCDMVFFRFSAERARFSPQGTRPISSFTWSFQLTRQVCEINVLVPVCCSCFFLRMVCSATCRLYRNGSKQGWLHSLLWSLALSTKLDATMQEWQAITLTLIIFNHLCFYFFGLSSSPCYVYLCSGNIDRCILHRSNWESNHTWRTSEH